MQESGDGFDAAIRAHARLDGDAHDDAGGFRSAVSGDRRGALWSGDARLAGVVPARGFALETAGSLSGGGQFASGAGSADGGAFRAPGRTVADAGPRFDQTVVPGGYAWWYVDAFSDDGRHGLTIIAFVGSVFSPYYAWKGRRDHENHCAINVALYGEKRRWAMTERGRRAVSRSSDAFSVGASALAWDGAGLDIHIDEFCAPVPRGLSGRVRLEAEGLNNCEFSLDSQGGHVWRPIAPLARVSVEMERPSLAWRGLGYFDFNRGAEPLEAAFSRWTWSRARIGARARVFYEAERRRAPPLSLSLGFARDGTASEVEPPPRAQMPKTLWRIARETRSEENARVLETLEDAPFYARSRIAHRLEGEAVASMHESLDLDRFSKPIVKAMLPFRMPRI